MICMAYRGLVSAIFKYVEFEIWNWIFGFNSRSGLSEEEGGVQKSEGDWEWRDVGEREMTAINEGLARALCVF